MSRKPLLMSAAMILTGSMAQAQINPQALADSYVAQGYSRVEVTVGPNDIKVEAIQGMTEVEVIYDRATGAILARESGRASLRDMLSTGVEVRERNRDALRDDDDAEGDDDNGSDDDEDDDDDNGGGRGGDDEDDDDNGGDRDDDSDDDSDDDAGEDDSDDDREGGRGRGRGGDD